MDDLERALNMHLPLGGILLRLGLAVVCGGIVGWDRQEHHKSAGLRTHMMVALGAATFMLLQFELDASLRETNPNFISDPARMLQGLITGIGFLGGGIIMRGEHGKPKGLTTAAGIWIICGVGACCGSGFYGLAIITTLLTVLVLKWFKTIERRTGIPEIEEPDSRE